MVLSLFLMVFNNICLVVIRNKTNKQPAYSGLSSHVTLARHNFDVVDGYITLDIQSRISLVNSWSFGQSLLILGGFERNTLLTFYNWDADWLALRYIWRHWYSHVSHVVCRMGHWKFDAVATGVSIESGRSPPNRRRSWPQKSQESAIIKETATTKVE